MSNLKLGVELVSAHNLMPKDGDGSTSSFVELHFESQKFRSTVKEKDLNPVWNESFYFNITDPTDLQNLTLDANVYNNNKATHTKSFLGRVRLNGTSFVPYSDAVVLHYPLEKRGMYSRVKGELGLKVFVTDDPSIRTSNPLPAVESFLNTDSRASQQQVQQEAPNPVPNPFSNDKADSRRTFHHLPKEHHHQHHSTNQQPVYYSAGEMKAEPQQPNIVRMYSASSSQPSDYALKETSPLSNLKLGVELLSAHNLMPKDGEGSASSFVQFHFEGQKYRSTVKEKDLNPVWNENFYFNITDPTNFQNLTLDANVYNNNKATQSKSFLGRVCLNGTWFVPYSDAVVLHHPLEKRGMFSRVQGELGLKVFVTDDPSIRTSNPLPAVESFLNTDSRASQQQVQQEAPNPVPNPFSNDKADSRRTFHHLPKEHHHQHHSTNQQPVYYSAGEMKAEPQQPNIVRMYSASSSQPSDYALKETSPLSNLKLGVELLSAHNLMPKDGEGSASSFVQFHFEGQKYRSTVKEKDLNPVWNENFYFNITDPTNFQNLTLDANVYNNNKATQSKSFLGRVCLNGTWFVPYSDAVVLHHPLEKCGMFSRVQGELGLKVFVTDDPSIRTSNPLPAVESFLNTDSSASQRQVRQQAAPNPVPSPFSNDKADSRHTFHHLPKEHHHQHHSTNQQQLVYYSANEMNAEPQQPWLFAWLEQLTRGLGCPFVACFRRKFSVL